MVNRVIIQSQHLREAFSELSDLPGAANVSITMAPAEPYFQLSAAGSVGTCTVSFPQVWCGASSCWELMPLAVRARCVCFAADDDCSVTLASAGVVPCLTIAVRW
jgi:hypothetical protein